ncbi:MAG: hypothetical protein Q8P24_15315 [Desulfobacterales bacterium]|nr:hypothetical protein [Desulfobacterales bacterium]
MTATNPETLSYGKKIEHNLIASLQLAGVHLNTSAALDHNHKIDFILSLNHQRVGIQFSLKQDAIKARVAKICALSVVPRFIYLCIAGEFFKRPDKQNGQDLYRALNNIARKYPDRALWINIGRQGLHIESLSPNGARP